MIQYKCSRYEVGLPTINHHINQIFNDNELEKKSTIRNFRIVQKEGNRSVSRDVTHYNLQMIIAVGFKVNNEKAVQFRKWANQIVKDYTIKGWVMDSERLKNGGSILTEKYFEEQLERIREIRMSEKRHIPMTSICRNGKNLCWIRIWKYRIVQDALYQSDFDKLLEESKKFDKNN